MNRSILAALLAAAGLLTLTACPAQCDPDTFVPTCDGNVAVTCPQPGVDQVVPTHLIRKACADKVCVTTGGAAFCALSADPDPACADVAADSPRCDTGESTLYCRSGFAVARYPCLRCDVSDAGTASCEGGPGSKCTADADCVSGYACSERGYCARTDAGQ